MIIRISTVWKKLFHNLYIIWKEHFNIDDVQLRDCHDLELEPFYFYYYDGVFYSAECPNGVSNLYRIPFIYRCIHMSKPILKEILQLRYPELGEINVINKSAYGRKSKKILNPSPDACFL